jgi:hypothetical protein
MLAGTHQCCSIKQFIQETIHTSQTKEDGFNTSQINSSINRIDSYITQKGSTHHKSTHPQIDPYNIEGGEGRPGGGESEIAPRRVSLVSRRRPPLTTPMQDLRPHPHSPPP